MPGSIESDDDEPLSVLDLSYFRHYGEFAEGADKHISRSGIRVSDLGDIVHLVACIA